MRLLVKYPTKWRWERFHQNLAKYIELSVDPSTTFLVTVDSDDMWPCGVPCPKNVAVTVTPPEGKVAAVNHGIPKCGWDLLMVASDDMTPLQTGWDATIREDFKRHPQAWMINYRAEPRLREKWRDLITLPIMTKECYDYFGYVYNPVYKSEFCDNEQTEIVGSLGRLVHVDHTPIIHEWVKFQVGELTRLNIEAGKADRFTYECRRANNFK
jgi:hypothetical protein